MTTVLESHSEFVDPNQPLQMNIEFYIDQIVNGIHCNMMLLDLRQIACNMAADGHKMEDVLKAMEHARKNLSSDDEDRLLEVMDFVSGWCQAHLCVYPP
ncbi:MAG: hypothetical protein NTV80_04350 [Verrucomicrobia bacterium]|nr:hypothetical protein [Verrucomicrobiota bacterium]